MTEELFREDSHLRECTAKVIRAEPGRIILDRTVFYPQGGGQPGDTGTLILSDGSGVTVLDAVKGDGEVVHVVGDEVPPPPTGTTVTARIDWDRRHRHMRMHTLLHLVCAVVPCQITGAQVGSEKSRIDFDVGDTALDKERITAELNRLIAEDHAVAPRWISDDELDANPDLIRTMSVQPPRGTGHVRLLDIEGVDLQPCGGTHVSHTGEIGPVAVSKIENKGKRNRRVNVILVDS